MIFSHAHNIHLQETTELFLKKRDPEVAFSIFGGVRAGASERECMY